MRRRTTYCFAMALLASTSATATLAQERAQPAADEGSTGNVLAEEIVVTATKKVGGETVLKAPVAVTAYGAPQLEAKFFHSLMDIGATTPNAQLNTGATLPGYANFTIRGLGTNSGAPSVEPTVGVFIDGIFIGTQAGILVDNFDLEGVEILRGPQGLLFGRNVTGGAVVIRTTRPSFTFSGKFRAAVETGLNKVISGVVTGPIIADTLAAKIAVYYNDDDGWFRNRFNGKSFGKNEQLLVRPALRFEPTSGVSLDLRYEYGQAKGDGVPMQNNALYDDTTFFVSNNNPGFADQHWHQVTAEANIEIAGGTLTNLFGYRKYSIDTAMDIDGSPSTFFHYGTATSPGILLRQDQVSNEIRYATTLGDFDVTTGGYYYRSTIFGAEQRILFGGAAGIISQEGGGQVRTESYAAFGSVDWHFAETLTLNLGGRYTWEKKAAKIARIRGAGTAGAACNIRTLVCNFDFRDKDSWRGFTPKIGLQWEPDGKTNVYGFFTRGFRGGGYNIRHTSPAFPPGPFDQETQDTFEVGAKRNFGNGNRLSVAAFRNKLKDLQREQTFPQGASVTQLIANTSDATIQGFEIEGQWFLTPEFMVSANLGYVHGKYDVVRFDISGDTIVNDIDKGLKIPKLRPWTFGIGATYDMELGSLGTLTARANYNHLDNAFQNDANVTRSPGGEFIDASLTLTLQNDVKLSVYGKNLLNEVTFGNNQPLPATFGGPGASATTLNKGRIIGGEVTYNF